MKVTILSLNTPKDFNFLHTIYSHGWCSLRPFSVDKKLKALNRILALSNGSIVQCQITHHKNSSLGIKVLSHKPLSSFQQSEIIQQITSSLRLAEDFRDFYWEAKSNPKFRWIAKKQAGRMLRAPSVFEDVVKMICTTNCSWSLTEAINNNLISEFGKPFHSTINSYPSPEALAGTTEKFLRKSIRAGYRSPFILEFAEKVAGNKLNVEIWRISGLPTNVLFKEIHSVKGVGDYAAGSILKLLGRYDYLGLDSWVRNTYYEMYHKGRRVSDRTIERRYEKHGKWQGLLFWLDMTKHWYDHKFPF